MGLKGCQITLDNPWNTYYAGQTVNGKVVFTFDSPKKIRGNRYFIIQWLCVVESFDTLLNSLVAFDQCGMFISPQTTPIINLSEFIFSGVVRAHQFIENLFSYNVAWEPWEFRYCNVLWDRIQYHIGGQSRFVVSCKQYYIYVCKCSFELAITANRLQKWLSTHFLWLDKKNICLNRCLQFKDKSLVQEKIKVLMKVSEGFR